MKKYILFILFVFFIVWQNFYSTLYALYPVMDPTGNDLPRNFRKIEEITTRKSPINQKGLSSLRLSGSGQFSEKNFNEVLRYLAISPQQLIVVDLRQESHGFINGNPISWTDGNYNYGNLHKSRAEIERDEAQRLYGAMTNKTLKLNSLKLKVHAVETERAFLEKNHVKYVRFPVTDHNRPTNEVIDQLIELVNSQFPDQWIHFHCRAGKGRTTTFLILIDIMKNARHVSLEDILVRQQWIGGADLNSTQRKDQEKHRAALGRLEFIQRFYLYCRENPEFHKSWSAWLEKQS